ncbi:hypothetical protein U8607_15365 [Methylobacterium durans]|uniref:DUF6894 family protein n=1 Tax=Methylobacterium durans TaxID=2202825 RepID=UPI002AFEBD16|nr:hypothetical protein [Methylobacterium durans]MEA1833463.1 hypothetical protein [Methylobacterium durans]
MPQRYFFRLVHAETVIEDTTGVVADDLDQALVEALAAIAELRTEGELPGDAGDWQLEIKDEAGILLSTLHLD